MAGEAFSSSGRGLPVRGVLATALAEMADAGDQDGPGVEPPETGNGRSSPEHWPESRVSGARSLLAWCGSSRGPGRFGGPAHAGSLVTSEMEMAGPSFRLAAPARRDGQLPASTS